MTESSRFRVAVLWKVIIPIAVVALLVGMIFMSKGNYECKSLCEAKGFYDARFTPRGRANSQPRCHCLTKEESAMKRRVPPGTEVYPWGR